MAFGKFLKIFKFENYVTRNDVIMMSLPKKWKNADVRETNQIIYHSKGLDQKCKFYQIWVIFSKVMGI